MHPNDPYRSMMNYPQPNFDFLMRSMMADMDRRLQEARFFPGMTRTRFDSPISRPDHFGLNMGFPDPFFGFDQGFGQFHQLAEGNQSPGSRRQHHTIMTTQRMGPDGRMVSENYINNEIYGITSEGKHISQKEEMYKNSGTGEKKISQERELDGVRHKVSKLQKKAGTDC